MSRGYLVIAQNNEATDYLRQAYALALSIKLTQRDVTGIAVAVDSDTKKLLEPKHGKVFDHIIDIPWMDDALNHEWKIHNKWKYYHMTPWDETVVLDTDMLFTHDVSDWWDIMAQQDFCATTTVRDFRGNPATDDFYRKVFRVNQLPNVYTAFMYFRKTQITAELFALVEQIFRHWQRFFWVYLGKNKPDWLSGDVAYALAIHILNIRDLTLREWDHDVPTFVHMKSQIQDTQGHALDEQWGLGLPTHFAGLDNIKIGNYSQKYPLHYVDKNWLTDDIMIALENSYAQQ